MFDDVVPKKHRRNNNNNLPLTWTCPVPECGTTNNKKDEPCRGCALPYEDARLRVTQHLNNLSVHSKDWKPICHHCSRCHQYEGPADVCPNCGADMTDQAVGTDCVGLPSIYLEDPSYTSDSYDRH